MIFLFVASQVSFEFLILLPQPSKCLLLGTHYNSLLFFFFLTWSLHVAHWPQTQRSTLLCLLSVGIKGVGYHYWLHLFLRQGLTSVVQVDPMVILLLQYPNHPVSQLQRGLTILLFLRQRLIHIAQVTVNSW